MSFRNYENVHPVCICRETPRELEKALDELQRDFDFIDLQFSTHFDNSWRQERFCALVLVARKGGQDGK